MVYPVEKPPGLKHLEYGAIGGHICVDMLRGPSFNLHEAEQIIYFNPSITCVCGTVLKIIVCYLIAAKSA